MHPPRTGTHHCERDAPHLSLVQPSPEVRMQRGRQPDAGQGARQIVARSPAAGVGPTSPQGGAGRCDAQHGSVRLPPRADHRRRSRLPQLLVYGGIHHRHHVSDSGRPLPQHFENLVRSFLAMCAVGPYQPVRVVDRGAMGRPIAPIEAAQQHFEAAQILPQVAVRRSDHAGGPPHHVVTGEQHRLLRQRVADVIAGMAGSVQGTNSHVAEIQFFVVFYATKFKPRSHAIVQYIISTGGLGQAAAAGDMVSMDVSINHVVNLHAGLLGDA